MSNLWVTRGPYRTIPDWPEFSVNRHGVVCRTVSEGNSTSAAARVGFLRKPQTGKSIRSTNYCFSSRGGRRKRCIPVKKLLADVWGVSFRPSRDWLDLVRSAVDEYNARVRGVKAEASRSKYLSKGARCCIRCGAALPDGYHRRCPDCMRYLEKYGGGSDWMPGRIDTPSRG